MRHFVLLFLSFLLLLVGCASNESKEPKMFKSEFPTEIFIRHHLLTEYGLMRTNLTDRSTEFLSESLGLYLLFLVERRREEEFADQIDVFTRYFLDDSGLVSWRLEQTEGEIVPSAVNAWIDDARIAHALYKAAEVFSTPTYADLANQIAAPLTTKAIRSGLPVDYVDFSTNQTGDRLTLSYLDESALRYMAPSSDLYENSKRVLKNAPLSGPFFAKSYSISEQTYQFDDEVNMIDQLYVALRYEQFGLATDSFYSFFKGEFDKGIVYGRYDRETNEPTVAFESHAVYALAVFYLLERDEREFAEKVMDRLKAASVTDPSSPYYGGYLDVPTRETHSFDNLLPLLAEGGLIDGYLVP